MVHRLEPLDGDGMHTLLRAAAGESSSAAYSEMIPYTYGTSGAFTATVTWSDFFYIEGTSSGVSLTVNPVVAATITASADDDHGGRSGHLHDEPHRGQRDVHLRMELRRCDHEHRTGSRGAYLREGGQLHRELDGHGHRRRDGQELGHHHRERGSVARS